MQLNHSRCTGHLNINKAVAHNVFSICFQLVSSMFNHLSEFIAKKVNADLHSIGGTITFALLCLFD